jgi:tetratricopeptide (TPR) repeat protein
MGQATMDSMKLEDLQRRTQSALATEDWSTAEQGLSELIVRAPLQVSLRYNRGLVRKWRGHLIAAVADFQASLIIAPEHTHARFELAAVLLDLGRFSAAGLDFQRYLTSAPEDADARLNLGRILVRLGQPDLAVGHLAQARGASGRPDVLLALAEAERDRGDLEACLVLLAGLPATDPGIAVRRIAVATQGPRGRIRLDAGQVIPAPPDR